MRGIESDCGNVSGDRNSEDGDNDVKQRLHFSVFESTIFT